VELDRAKNIIIMYEQKKARAKRQKRQTETEERREDDELVPLLVFAQFLF
jgi:hypothetical protein